MDNHRIILSELDAYAKSAGVDVSTVCRKATGNPRLRDRLINRMKRLDNDVERLRQYMAKNPVEKDAGSLACPVNIPANAPEYKGADT